MFGQRKDKSWRCVFIFRSGKSNVIYDLVEYLLCKGLNMSLLYDCTIPFQYLKTVFAMQDSTFSETGSQFISQR